MNQIFDPTFTSASVYHILSFIDQAEQWQHGQEFDAENVQEKLIRAFSSADERIHIPSMAELMQRDDVSLERYENIDQEDGMYTLEALYSIMLAYLVCRNISSDLHQKYGSMQDYFDIAVEQCYAQVLHGLRMTLGDDDVYVQTGTLMSVLRVVISMAAIIADAVRFQLLDELTKANEACWLTDISNSATEWFLQFDETFSTSSHTYY